MDKAFARTSSDIHGYKTADQTDDRPEIEIGCEDCPVCGHPIWHPLNNLIANCPDAKFYQCGACGADLRIKQPNDRLEPARRKP